MSTLVFVTMVVLKSKHRVTLNGKVGTHQRNQCSQVNNCVFFSSTPPPYLPPSCSFPRAPSPPSHGCTCPRADRGAGPSRRGATGGRGGDAGRNHLHLRLLLKSGEAGWVDQPWGTLWYKTNWKGARDQQIGEAKEGVSSSVGIPASPPAWPPSEPIWWCNAKPATHP